MPSILLLWAEIKVAAATVSACPAKICKTMQGDAQSPFCELHSASENVPEQTNGLATDVLISGEVRDWWPALRGRPRPRAGLKSVTANRGVASVPVAAIANGAKIVIRTKNTLYKNNLIGPGYHRSALP